MSESVMKGKSFSFAVKIVILHSVLRNSKKEFVLSNQLLRSGTSIGAMVREAQNAESKADFEHKLAIAQKECDESLYWLELLVNTNYITDIEYDSYYSDASELLKIIRSAIIASKSKHQSTPRNTHNS